MADNTLMWERLDKNETIEELIRKINNNFSQFAMHNGGSPGQAGKDGFSASVLMNRCSVHSVTQDDIVRRVNELGNSSVDDITFEEYLGGKKVPDVIIGDYFDGDIIYFKNKIYEYSKNTTPDYKLIHSISGEKGDKGDTGSGISKFVHSTEYIGIPDYAFDDYLFFNDLGNNNKPSHMIMMNAADYVGNHYTISSEDAVESNSLLMVKENESTGIGFLKLNNNELTYQGKIQLDGNDDLRIHNNNKLWIDSVDRLNLQCLSHESYTSSGGYISIEPDEIVIHASSISIRDATFGKNYIDLDANRIHIGMVEFYGGDPDDEDNVNVHRINLEGIKNIDINQSNGLSIGKINIKDYISNGNLIQTTLQSKGKLEISTEDTGDILITTNCYGNIELCSEDKFTLNFNDEIQYEITENGSGLVIDAELNLKEKKLTCGDISANSIDSSYMTASAIKAFDDIYISENSLSNSLGLFTPINSGRLAENGYRLSQIIETLTEQIKQLKNDRTAIAEDKPIKTLPVGSIIMSASRDEATYSSYGYAFCNGRTLASIFGNTVDGRKNATPLFKALTGSNSVPDQSSMTYTKIPDLTSKFPRGKYTSNAILSSGGSDTVSLEVKNLPPHNHKYAGNEDMWGSNPYSPFRVEPRVGVRKSGGDSSSGYLYYTQSVGNGIPFNVIPAYQEVFFYIKISDEMVEKDESSSSGSGSESGSSSGSESGSGSGSGSSQQEEQQSIHYNQDSIKLMIGGHIVTNGNGTSQGGGGFVYNSSGGNFDQSGYVKCAFISNGTTPSIEQLRFQAQNTAWQGNNVKFCYVEYNTSTGTESVKYIDIISNGVVNNYLPGQIDNVRVGEYEYRTVFIKNNIS